MKREVFVLLFLFGILSFASASDVAYIYHSDSKVDSNFISVFTELGLTTDLIDEKELPLDFSKYKFILVGDERFRKEIPVGDYPSVVVNYHYGTEWGLTDRDGVSQLGSTAPLSVVQDNRKVMVYTQAFKRGRIAVPYYYLSNKNKADSLRQVCATKTTSSGHKFGDVVSYTDAGSILTNGKVAQGNICFFGIVESEFWTSEARELFKDCVGFASSWVEPPPAEIECSTNEDCGVDGFVEDPF